MKVLIVDDESYVLEGLSVMIDWEALGVEELVTASNGEEALSLFYNLHPGLLITDVSMPRMNGLMLIAEIRKTHPQLPVIILSGYDEFDFARQAIDLNVTKYLLKPSVKSEVEAAIREVLMETQDHLRQETMLKELRQQMEESRPVLREQLLNDLVTSGWRSGAPEKGAFEFFRIDERIQFGGLVLGLKAYRYDNHRFEDETDWQLFKFALANIATELAAESGAFVLRYMGDMLPIFMYGSEAEQLTAMAERLAQAVAENAAFYLQVDVNAGIGQYVPHRMKYPLSLKQAGEALTFAESEGYKQIVRYDKMPERDHSLAYPLEQIRLLKDALLRGDLPVFRENWQDMAEMMNGDTSVNLAFLQTICTGLVSSLALQVMETFSLQDMPERTVAILQAVSRERTKESLLAAVGKELAGLGEALFGEAPSRARSQYVEWIYQYVSEHYAQSISFGDIAKRLGLSRNYLSHLFKRETGTSFMSYLTHYRINRSKELLKTGRYMVYEVGEMVGCPDPAYFSRLFKQIANVSPLEYSLKFKNNALLGSGDIR